MRFELTTHCQHSKKCKDGSYRNFLLYFINGVLVMRHKVPYDESMAHGWQGKWHISDIYYENGRIHQTRSNGTTNTRKVSFPVSKEKLAELGVPEGIRLEADTTRKTSTKLGI